MVILTTYQVIARYIFNSPSTWSEELVGYLFGWSTLFGATIVSGERGHMNIPILVDRMNPGMRKAFHILWEVVAFLFSATILVFGGFQVSKLAMGQQTSSLNVAVGYVLLGHAHLRRGHPAVFHPEHHRHCQRHHLAGGRR